MSQALETYNVRVKFSTGQVMRGSCRLTSFVLPLIISLVSCIITFFTAILLNLYLTRLRLSVQVLGKDVFVSMHFSVVDRLLKKQMQVIEVFFRDHLLCLVFRLDRYLFVQSYPPMKHLPLGQSVSKDLAAELSFLTQKKKHHR